MFSFGDRFYSFKWVVGIGGVLFSEKMEGIINFDFLLLYCTRECLTKWSSSQRLVSSYDQP